MAAVELTNYIWLGVAVLTAVVEAAVPALVSIWFVPGALGALIVSLLGGAVWLQIVVFLAVSSLALIITRPIAKKLQNGKSESTNADMVIGRSALVTEEIDNIKAAGRVSVLGNSWSARTTDGSVAAVGETVTVERIEGVKLIVSAQKRGE